MSTSLEFDYTYEMGYTLKHSIYKAGIMASKISEFKKRFSYSDGKLFYKEGTGNANASGDRAGTKVLNKPYRKCKINGKYMLEHRIIFALVYGYMPKCVDHILDDLNDEGVKSNKAENLQDISQGANIQKAKKRKGTSSIYKGVYFNKEKGLWQAYAKKKYIGRFKTEDEAARAYDSVIKSLYNDTAYTNF